MALLTENQLEKYSNEIVNQFIHAHVPMTESVIKIAERENFNPEQIKRLVEAANNTAFQQKFNGAEGTDRMDASEFETANPDTAIQRLIGAAKDVMNSLEQKSCPDISEDDFSSDLPITRPEIKPLDMASPEDNLTPLGEPKIRGHIMIMKLQKTAALLKEKEYQQRIELTDTFQKLATYFTKCNNKAFEIFEKDAFYKWGPLAAPHLQLLRQSLKKETALYDPDAMQKIARVIDSSTPEMQLFVTMLKCSQDIQTLRQGIAKTAEYLKNLETCPS